MTMVENKNKVVALQVTLIQAAVVLLAPLWLLLLLLGWVWRWVVIQLGKQLKLDLIPVAHPDLLFITDSLAHPHSAYTPTFVLQGIPSKANVTAELQRVFDIRDEKGCRPFWKLGVYPIQWMGYWFWKKVDNFQIGKQVVYVDDWNLSTEQDVARLFEVVLRRRFPPGSPWWDVTIATNYLGENKSLAIFRSSHSVMDGYSFVKWCFKLSGMNQLPSDVPVDTSLPTPFSILHFANFAHQLMTEGLKEYLTIWNSLPQTNIFREGPLCLGSPAELPSGDWMCSYTPRIPLEKVKTARKAFDTSFYCIVLSAVVGGLRTFAHSQEWGDEKLPDSIKTMIPVSKPGHPTDNALCNHWRPMIIDLPLGNRDTASTVTSMHLAIEKWKHSTSSEFSGVVCRLLELLPLASYIDDITRFEGLTLISSIVPTSNNVPPMFGQIVEEVFHLMPINRENVAALAWGCMSSNGTLRIALTAEKLFFRNRQHIHQIAHCIELEFENIYQLAQHRTVLNQGGSGDSN